MTRVPNKEINFNLGWGIWLVILSFPFSLGFAGYQVGQMNANAVRAQAQAQREAQAEFIKAIQAAGMEVHMEPEPEPRPGIKG